MAHNQTKAAAHNRQDEVYGDSSTLNMEAAISSETSACFYQTVPLHMPDDSKWRFSKLSQSAGIDQSV